MTLNTVKNIVLGVILGAGVSAAAIVLDPIPKFVQVNEGIFRGGRPVGDGMSQLRDYGIKTDINLQGGDIDFKDPSLVAFMKWWEPGETLANIAAEKQWAEDVYHMKFVPAPLNSLTPVTDTEDQLVDQILSVMADKSAQPVFVHCEHGQDRTGLIIALYQVKYQNMSLEDAHQEWVASGHSGVGAYFTGYLDIYFYKKAAKIVSERTP